MGRVIRTGEWFDLPRGSVQQPTFAIGDVHGFLDELNALLEHLDHVIDQPSKLVFLGDHIDRGPASGAVLARLRRGMGRADIKEIVLRGNHDQYLISALDGDPTKTDHWLRWGGAPTLKSLKVSAHLRKRELAAALLEALGQDLVSWLRSLPLTYQSDEVFFVHAGLNPKRPIDDQLKDDLIWIRGEFLNCPENAWPFEPLVIHGHSPFAFGVDHHRICVDSHCYETGVLTALEMRGTKGRYHQTV